VFTDIEHGAEHVSNIRKVEVMTAGEFTLGTRWLETRALFGQQDTAEMEVTAFERNRTCTITHHKAGARIEIVFVFEPLDHGTKVRIDFDLRSPGLPPGAMAPLRWAIAGKVREAIAQDLEDLKRAIEGSA